MYPEVALFLESDADADVVAADDVEQQHNATDILFCFVFCARVKFQKLVG